MNDPVIPNWPSGFFGHVIFICACLGAYGVTMILLIVVGVNGKIADSTGAAIAWFMVLDRFSRHNRTSSTPKIVTMSIVAGLLRYASLILTQYFSSSAGK